MKKESEESKKVTSIADYNKYKESRNNVIKLVTGSGAIDLDKRKDVARIHSEILNNLSEFLLLEYQKRYREEQRADSYSYEAYKHRRNSIDDMKRESMRNPHYDTTILNDLWEHHRDICTEVGLSTIIKYQSRREQEKVV